MLRHEENSQSKAAKGTMRLRSDLGLSSLVVADDSKRSSLSGDMATSVWSGRNIK